MSAEESAELDLARKMNLIEAMLNADGKEPQARRLDGQVAFFRLAVVEGHITIENDDLWLSFESEATRLRVTDYHVSDIIGLIEGHVRG